MSPTIIDLDVSHLPAPEPLVKILSSLDSLKYQQILRVKHRLKPCMLFDKLEPMGLDYDYQEPLSEMSGHVILFWKKNDLNTREWIKNFQITNSG